MGYVRHIEKPVKYVGRVRNVTAKIVDTNFGFKAMLKIENSHKEFGWLNEFGHIVTFTVRPADTHHYFETIEAARRAAIRGVIQFGDEVYFRKEDFL